MKLSIVIPCYNEEEVIATSYKRFTAVMEANSYDYELLFVNDGSKDRTEELLTGFAQDDHRVKLISLIETYEREQCNVVYAVRRKRKGESFFKRMTAKLFYRGLNLLSDFSFPVDTGDFRLIDRYVLDAFRQFPEKHKYLRGLFCWMGFKQVPFYYDRDERKAGETKYTLTKMIRLASVGLFGFSKKPLRLAISLGCISILIALALVLWILYLNLPAVLLPMQIQKIPAILVGFWN